MTDKLQPGLLSKVRSPDILTIAPCFSFDEVEVMTGIGRTTLYEHAKAGSLIVRKCNGRSVILREDLETWLNGLPLLQNPTITKEQNHDK